VSKKKPAFGARIAEASKEPRISPEAAKTPDERRPAWRFQILDLDGPWSWSNVPDAALLHAIRDRLRNYESMTWREIKQNDNSGSHAIPIDRLCLEAQKRLMALKQDDAATLFSLRINQKQRVWGIRDEHIFRILWWDPEHTVCPVAKRHT